MQRFKIVIVFNSEVIFVDMVFETDSVYISRIRSGDPASYSFLVDKHKKMAFHVSVQVLGSREDAEEVTQDAFLKAYQSINKYKGDSKFSTWLYRIVYNAAISHLRKKKT